MPTYLYDQDDNNDCDIDGRLVSQSSKMLQFGIDGYICMSIRMRLDCRIINREGAIKARYNVLNEVVIVRGSLPYLAALECFFATMFT
jgi:NAD kinase